MKFLKTHLAVLLVTTAGCATTSPTPTASLDAARSAISSAERIDAGRFATFDLDEARERFALAQTAASNADMVVAERLANEARIGAELAYARTETAKAQAIYDEMQRGEAALIDEMRRSGEQR